MHFPAASSSSSAGSASPSLSLHTGTADDSLSTLGDQRHFGTASGATVASGGAAEGRADGSLNLQIFVPDLKMQKCLCVSLDEFVWDIKFRLLRSLPQKLDKEFNFGLFLPPCDGRAGKFLLEDRQIREYPFHDCVPYVELKYKKRVYKMLRLDEKALNAIHSRSTLKKVAEAVQGRNATKVERLCAQGLDPNHHDTHGESLLTLAAGVEGNREVIVQLVGGGAHLDFRNAEGQTCMHKAAFLSIADNVRTLLELGASPNYRDLIGLTPLYYNMLNSDSSPEVAQMLLAEAADLDVVDMHGNTAMHQACKNGLAKHVELLIYYGADANAQNVNGNTPLHVCAVNGRVDCAQVLLYRGADPTLLNRQGQDPVQVAQCVGTSAVAEVIQGHDPRNIVPFRDVPLLNPRRRLCSRQSNAPDHLGLRRRSLSHCSSSSTMASAHRFSGHHHPPASPSLSLASSSVAGEYGTLRRESVQQHLAFEPNIPRILVIPRGRNGFGFILRGAKDSDPTSDGASADCFRPSRANPALQFFEGIVPHGMAARAGLLAGDFLLEVNGVDVRSASHGRVVKLIHQSGDPITLKVITVVEQGHYASAGGTLGRRNLSAPRHVSFVPPPPPQRDPSTALSYGRTVGQPTVQFYASDLPPPLVAFHASSSVACCSAVANSSAHPFLCRPRAAPSASPPRAPSPPPPVPPSSDQIRCASVKLGRVSANRRISAAELEHLMSNQPQQQNGTGIMAVPNPTTTTTTVAVEGGPKKFTSVNEMKRRKQQNAQQQQQLRSNFCSTNAAESCAVPLKNSNSSPELHGTAEFRTVLRPKTPPPPPPAQKASMGKQTKQRQDGAVRQEANATVQLPTAASGNLSSGEYQTKQSQQLMPIYASTVLVQVHHDLSTTANSVGTAPSQRNRDNANPNAPPAPPPPPPPNWLRMSHTHQKQPGPPTEQNVSVHRSSASSLAPSQAKGAGGNVADCRGVSAEALQSVRLRPIAQDERKTAPGGIANGPSTSASMTHSEKVTPPADFDADLRSALAKRRSKVQQKGGNDGTMPSSTCNPTAENNDHSSNSANGMRMENHYAAGLSLRESVIENVAAGVAKGVAGSTAKPVAKSHSPTSAFTGCKKDSGYTSSRTSLEPSDYGDTDQQNPPQNIHHSHAYPHQQQQSLVPPSLPVQHRVTVLSQQMEAAASAAQSPVSLRPTPAESQTHSQANATQVPLSLPISSPSLPRRAPLLLENTVKIPAVDYDDQQPGTSSGQGTKSCSSDSGQGSSTGSEDSAEGIVVVSAGCASPSPSFNGNSSPISTGTFKKKSVESWGSEDVVDWLASLGMGEYAKAFARTTGRDLLQFDRAQFTALGVTRIAHRQEMEQSLRSFS